MKTSEVLNKAADLIESRGWAGALTRTPGRSSWDWGGTGDGPICLEGGILAALGNPRGWCSAFINQCPAGAAVREHLSTTEDDLWRWNDKRERTAEQVIETLRAAAVIEAAKETADERESVTA